VFEHKPIASQNLSLTD